MNFTISTESEGTGGSVHRRPFDNVFVLLISVTVLLVSIGYVFVVPGMTGDTFMTLAGGRDVVEGKLAQPDDWSFVSEGRVWVNQSWGTGVLFYKLWNEVGYVGLVIYKAVLVGLLGLFLVLASRQFGASYTMGALVAGYILAASANFINIRANLFGLVALALLLWILYCSQGRPHRIWFAMTLLVIWAHMHGSFIFGIAVLGLWMVVQVGFSLWKGRRGNELRSLWPLPVATLSALVLATATSPFGVRNLTQPFSLMGFFVDEAWPLPNLEMTPLLSDYPGITTFLGLGWYLFTLGCLAAPLALRVIRPTDDIPGVAELGENQLIEWTFAFILAAITIIMSFTARRFVPVSLIACAPLLAFELQWLLAHRRYAWPFTSAMIGSLAFGLLMGQFMNIWNPAPNAFGPDQGMLPSTLRWTWGVTALILVSSPLLGLRFHDSVPDAIASDTADQRESGGWIAWLKDHRRLTYAPAVVSLVLLGILAVQLQRQILYHRSDTPFYLDHDEMFDRLIMMGQFPNGAAEFFDANDIQGNVVNFWPWEGFLRWRRPELKLLVGGRSRQVYSSQAARDYQTAFRTHDDSFFSQRRIQLVAVPASDPLAARIFKEAATPWRIIYYDGHSLVAASKNDPAGHQLIKDAEAGKLIYPSEQSEKHTLAARRLAISSYTSKSEKFEALAAATETYPTFQLYRLLLLQQAAKRAGASEIVAFFESELSRLHDRDDHHPLGYQVLQSRLMMAGTVADYYVDLIPQQSDKVRFWRRYSRECDAAANALAAGRPKTSISEIPGDWLPQVTSPVD